MATPKLTTASPSYGPVSYITVADYKQAPTGVNTDNLVPGNASASDAELANRIRAASSQVEGICGQSLAATLDTINTKGTVTRDGRLIVHPPKFPIMQLNSFSYGPLPSSQTTLSDLSNVWIDNQQIEVPLVSGTWSSAGPLQFGYPPRPGGQLYISYTAVSGFVVTKLSAPATAAATTITVSDATGVVPGVTWLQLADGPQTEIVYVSSTSVVGSTTLTLTGPLAFGHPTSTSVSGVPESVRQATILLTSTLVQTRGAVAIIAPAVGGMSARYSQSGSQRARSQRVPVDDNADLAEKLLVPFTRLR